MHNPKGERAIEETHNYYFTKKEHLFLGKSGIISKNATCLISSRLELARGRESNVWEQLDDVFFRGLL